jgi:hypothetical protein
MFRRIMRMIAFVAVFSAAWLAIPSTAEAWRSYGYYYNVPRTTYGYATNWGVAYPGAPYYPGFGPPYYPGYGPPYYPGYGPPYVSRSGYAPTYYYGIAQPYYVEPDVMYWR